MSRPGVYRDSWFWNAGLASYWFASTFKWSILLASIIPGQVKAIVPAGTENSSWGQVFAIGALWAIIGPALFGHLSDRLGRRKPFIAAGSALTVIGLAVMADASTLGMLIVGYLLLQISDDVGTGPYGGVIPTVVPEDRRGFASSVMSQLQLSAQILSAVTGLILKDPRFVYLAVGLVNVTCAVITLTVMRPIQESKPEEKPDQPRETFAEGWVKPWKSPDFRWVWITRFLAVAGLTLILNYLRFYFEATYNQDAQGRLFMFGQPKFTGNESVMVVILFIAVFGAIGAVLSARRIDKWGRKRVVRGAALIVIGCLAAFAVVRDIGHALLFAPIFGIGYGSYLAAEWAMAIDVAPDPETLGKDMGLWSSSQPTAQFLVGNVGWVIDAANRARPDSGYMAMIAIAIVCFLIGRHCVGQIQGSS